MSAWLDQVFDAKQVETEGGVVRRDLADVDKLSSRADFRAEAKKSLAESEWLRRTT